MKMVEKWIIPIKNSLMVFLSFFKNPREFLINIEKTVVQIIVDTIVLLAIPSLLFIIMFSLKFDIADKIFNISVILILAVILFYIFIPWVIIFVILGFLTKFSDFKIKNKNVAVYYYILIFSSISVSIMLFFLNIFYFRENYIFYYIFLISSVLFAIFFCVFFSVILTKNIKKIVLFTFIALISSLMFFNTIPRSYLSLHQNKYSDVDLILKEIEQVIYDPKFIVTDYDFDDVFNVLNTFSDNYKIFSGNFSKKDLDNFILIQNKAFSITESKIGLYIDELEGSIKYFESKKLTSYFNETKNIIIARNNFYSNCLEAMLQIKNFREQYKYLLVDKKIMGIHKEIEVFYGKTFDTNMVEERNMTLKETKESVKSNILKLKAKKKEVSDIKIINLIESAIIFNYMYKDVIEIIENIKIMKDSLEEFDSKQKGANKIFNNNKKINKIMIYTPYYDGFNIL